MNQAWARVDPFAVVVAYGLLVLLGGVVLVAVGYRTDRKQVPYDWARYWHWWRVCALYAGIGSLGIMPVTWAVYAGRPRLSVAVLGGVTFLLYVFAIPSLHWRLWTPMFGMGLHLRTYLVQSVRSLGYAMALAVAGAVLVLLGGAILGR